MNLFEKYSGRLRHLCEVGVNEPQLAQLKPWLNTGFYESAILVEPHPVAGANCLRAYGRQRGVQVLRVAVGFQPGALAFIDHGQSSFAADLPTSPARANHEREDGPRFTALAVRFDEIDPGNLDLLCVDTEGMEWAVVSQMKSHPLVIKLETHFTGSGYVNPYLDQILSRLLLEYRIVHVGVADMVFERRA